MKRERGWERDRERERECEKERERERDGELQKEGERKTIRENQLNNKLRYHKNYVKRLNSTYKTGCHPHPYIPSPDLLIPYLLIINITSKEYLRACAYKIIR